MNFVSDGFKETVNSFSSPVTPVTLMLNSPNGLCSISYPLTADNTKSLTSVTSCIKT